MVSLRQGNLGNPYQKGMPVVGGARNNPTVARVQHIISCGYWFAPGHVRLPPKSAPTQTIGTASASDHNASIAWRSNVLAHQIMRAHSEFRQLLSKHCKAIEENARACVGA